MPSQTHLNAFKNKNFCHFFPPFLFLLAYFLSLQALNFYYSENNLFTNLNPVLKKADCEKVNHK